MSLLKYLFNITLLVSLVIFNFSCKDDNPVESNSISIDSALPYSWYNSNLKIGLQFFNNGEVFKLYVDSEGKLANYTTPVTEMKLLSASGGKWVGVNPTTLADTSEGEYSFQGNTLIFKYIKRDGVVLLTPQELEYTKTNIGARVVYTNYLTAQVGSDIFRATSMTKSYNSEDLLMTARRDNPGIISIRVKINSVGSVQFVGANQAAYAESSSMTFSTDGSAYSGTLSVLELDKENRYISGNFSFEGISTQSGTKRVSNGKFGFKY